MSVSTEQVQSGPSSAGDAAGAAASWLAVRAGAHALLIPLSHAGEVGVLGEVQALPHTKDWFLGVINARGVLCNVIDLAAFLDQRTPEARSDSVLARCQLIRFNPLLQLQSALLVDEIVGMRSVQGFVDGAPRATEDVSYLGATYIDAKGDRWREIDLQGMASDPLFLDIQA